MTEGASHLPACSSHSCWWFSCWLIFLFWCPTVIFPVLHPDLSHLPRVPMPASPSLNPTPNPHLFSFDLTTNKTGKVTCSISAVDLTSISFHYNVALICLHAGYVWTKETQSCPIIGNRPGSCATLEASQLLNRLGPWINIASWFLAIIGWADSLVTKHEDTLYDPEGKINFIFHHPPESETAWYFVGSIS